MSEVLKNNRIKIIGDHMRIKRNQDIYKGGALITEKEVEDYFSIVKESFELADKYFNQKVGKVKLFSIIF